MGSLTALRNHQWGLESTPGTAVAATERILGADLSLTPTDAIDRTALMRGFMLRETGDENAMSRGVNWSASGPLLYEQAHTWLGMVVQGGVSASGSGDYRTWALSRGISAIPALNSMTFRRRMTGSVGSYDERAAYCMAQSFGTAWTMDGPVTFNASGFGRRLVTESITSITGVDNQPVVEKALSNRATVAIDNTFAGLGGTAMTGRVIGGSMNILTGTAPRPTMDGRTDLDFTVAEYDASQTGAELTLRVLLDPQTAGNGDYGTEKAAAELAALRAVQIVMTGSEVDTGVDRSITLKLTAKHVAGSLVSLGTDGGQDIIELSMTSASDGVNPWLGAVIVNGRAAYADGTAAA